MLVEGRSESIPCDNCVERKTGHAVWLWPNIVGLDAPVVAVIWQRYFATAFGARPPVVASIVLGLIVWGVYLGDHWLDARPGRPVELAPRHQFARQHRFALGVCTFVILLSAAALILFLPIRYIKIGTVTAIAMAGYLACVHALGGLGELAKTLLVGLLFAVGVAIPLAADRADSASAWLPACAAFAAIAWLNCRLIAGWESGRPARPAGILATVAFVSVLAAFTPWPVALALGGALGLLIVLHLGREWVRTDLLRVLADVALLTPLAFWAWT